MGVQRPTTRHYVERESKLEVFILSLPSELRESHGRGGGKISGVRMDGGHQENMAR